MPLRKLLIHVMLWSLAATAVLAAFNALAGSGEAGWRFVGTGITFAIGTAIMLPFSVRADKAETRWDGLAGMAAVIVLVLGIVGLMWNVFGSLFGSRFEDKVGMSLLFFAATALPTVGFLRLMLTPEHRLAAYNGLGLSAATFFLLLVAAWAGPRYGPHEQWAVTGGSLGGFGVLGVLALLGMNKRRPWRWVGVLAAVTAIAMATIGTWQEIHEGGTVFAIVISIAAVIAHANLCLIVPLNAGQRWLPYPTIAAGLATAVFLDLLVAADGHFEMAEKLASATGILAGCGTLALLVLAKLNKQLDRKPVVATDIKAITVICPACDTKQTMPAGKDTACIGCGLLFNILVVEPRCPQCDYLLFKLQADRCPECGFELKNRDLSASMPIERGRVESASISTTIPPP